MSSVCSKKIYTAPGWPTQGSHLFYFGRFQNHNTGISLLPLEKKAFPTLATPNSPNTISACPYELCLL